MILSTALTLPFKPAPVLELFLVDLVFQFADARLHSGLRIGHAPVVNTRPNLLQDEFEQRVGAKISQAFLHLGLEILLEGLDRALLCFVG